MENLTIRPTRDYPGIYRLFYDSKLEVKPDGPADPAAVIDCWEALLPGEGRVAAAELELRAGTYVLGAIAVEEAHRGTYIGRALVETVIEKVRQLGGTQLMLVAKVPKFYQKLGFDIISREEAPDISHCFTCAQFQVDCFPSIMRLELGGSGEPTAARP